MKCSILLPKPIKLDTIIDQLVQKIWNGDILSAPEQKKIASSIPLFKDLYKFLNELQNIYPITEKNPNNNSMKQNLRPFVNLLSRMDK